MIIPYPSNESFLSVKPTLDRYEKELQEKGWIKYGAGFVFNQRWKGPDGTIIVGTGEAYCTVFPK